MLLSNQGQPVSSQCGNKGNQPSSKMPVVHLAHLEEEDASRDEDQKSDDPDRIEGVMEEFMVCLTRAVKDAQVDKKCCYHCSSLDHFICNCPLIKALREKGQLNGKEGMAMRKGAQTPPMKANTLKRPQKRLLRCKAPQQTPFLNLDPFQHWHGIKNVARLKINNESCTALLDNGTQINTIMPKYVSDHLLQMGLITNLLGAKVTCVGLGNAYKRLLGYIVIRV